MIPSKEELEDLYFNKNYTIRGIAAFYRVGSSTPDYWFRKLGINRRTHGEAAVLRDKLKRRNYNFLFERTMANHPNWKGGRRISSAGYVELKISTHPRARRNGYVFEHLVVYEQHFGSVPKGSHIHHKNGNKQDNRIENLQLMTPKEHISVIPDLFKKIAELEERIIELRKENELLKKANCEF